MTLVQHMSVWGRQRLVLLQLAYAFLTAKDEISLELVGEIFEKMDLEDKIGNFALSMAKSEKIDPNGTEQYSGLRLAERLYAYILASDERMISSFKNDKPDGWFVFKDPLIHSRYASSLFLQERYGEAKSALERILQQDAWQEIESFDGFNIFDVSKYEIWMRHSQYIFFRSYADDMKIINYINEIIVDLEGIIRESKHLQGDSDKALRAMAWAFLIIKYLSSMRFALPDFFANSERAVESYLSGRLKEVISNTLQAKPEVTCAMAILGYIKKSGAVRKLNADTRYPKSSREAFLGALERILGSGDQMESSKPKVFFSYSHKDKSNADRVIHYLDEYGLKVISDNDFLIGDSLQNRMANSIDDSDFAIIFATESYLSNTSWANQEMKLLLEEATQGEIELMVICFEISPSTVRKSAPFLGSYLMHQVKGEMIGPNIAVLVNNIFRKKQQSDRRRASR